MSVLHLLTLALLISVSGAKFSGRPGVNYGQLGNNLPSPSDSVTLIKSLNAKSVKLYDANPSILAALNSTDIVVSIMVPNELLVNITKSKTLSDDWIRSNVLPFYPSTKIRYLLVGNEILSSQDSELKSALVPAMRKIQRSLKTLGVKKVKVGTTLAMDVLNSSYPPSSGEFRSDISGSVMKPMLQFLNRTKSFLFVDVYPYFPWAQDPAHIDLNYALFEPTNVTVVDPVTNLTYHNLFDQMIDALVFAMKRLGYPDLRIWVAETGWPNNGDYDQIGANIHNAATYNRNVVKKLAAEPPVGTPARPGKVLPAFIFALYNENQKPGPGTERHFGLLHPNGSQVYEIELSGKTTEYKEALPAPENNEVYKGKIWCVVAKGANWTQLGDALSYACSQGNNTCDPIKLMAAVGQWTPLCVASPSPRVNSATCISNLSPTTVSSRTELAAFRPQFRLFSRVSPSRRRLYAASSSADSGIFLPHLVASMEQVEETYIMVKPDGIQRGLVGEIISRFEKKGFKLIGLKMFQCPKDLAEEHYKDLSAKSFFPSLIEYITSGPVVCMAWEGVGVVASARKLIGKTDPLQAEPGTIRGDLAVQTGRNIVHGSDSPENGKREIALWFKEGELCEWDSALATWLRE